MWPSVAASLFGFGLLYSLPLLPFFDLLPLAIANEAGSEG